MSDASNNTEIPGWESVNMQNPREVIRHAAELYGNGLTLACSFSMEDVMLAYLLKKEAPEATVFALDTGRLNPETYECAEALSQKYDLNIQWYFPQRQDIEDLVRKKGMFSFRNSVLDRKECCYLRKVEPLGRALEGKKAWITGLRREHGQTRTDLQVVEKDDGHNGIVKLNPLADYSSEKVRTFVLENGIPYNRLHDMGYPSIGCAPCTRAVQPGEGMRAGRWWWEDPEHKECGLHVNVSKNRGLGI